jgi:hypothetical protein
MLFASLPHYASLPASPPPPLGMQRGAQPGDATAAALESGAGNGTAAAAAVFNGGSGADDDDDDRSSGHGSGSGGGGVACDPALERALCDDALLAGLSSQAGAGGGDYAEATLRSING